MGSASHRVSAMTREQKAVRLERMCDRFEHGSRPADIAKSYGLSAEYVRAALHERGYDTTTPAYREKRVDSVWEMDEDRRRHEIIRRAAEGARAARLAIVETSRAAEVPAIPASKAKPMTPRDRAMAIIADAATLHGVTVDNIMGPSRSPQMFKARARAVYHIVMDLGWSFSRIGRLMNRNHSSMIFALKEHIKRDPTHEAAYLAKRAAAEERRAKSKSDAMAMHAAGGFKQSQIADSVGVSEETVRMWIAGTRN